MWMLPSICGPNLTEVRTEIVLLWDEVYTISGLSIFGAMSFRGALVYSTDFFIISKIGFENNIEHNQRVADQVYQVFIPVNHVCICMLKQSTRVCPHECCRYVAEC